MKIGMLRFLTIYLHSFILKLVSTKIVYLQDPMITAQLLLMVSNIKGFCTWRVQRGS